MIIAGDTISITSNYSSGSFSWNTGETTPSIQITEAGTYSLQVTQDDQSVSKSITIEKAWPIGEVRTDSGDIHIWLHEVTPLHRQMFIKLARQGYYNQFFFNRVIPKFVIQGGYPDEPIYFENSPYLIDPEFVDSLKHIKGAVDMGRDNNPNKESNGCQFYIVNKAGIGLPFLDGDYTIFGRVIQGIETVNRITWIETNAQDEPLDSVPLEVNILIKNSAMILADYGMTVD